MAIVKFEPLVASMAQVVERNWIHRFDLKFALAIFKQYWVKKKYNISRLFAENSVYLYVSLSLVPKWYKRHKFNNAHNSVGKSVNG